MLHPADALYLVRYHLEHALWGQDSPPRPLSVSVEDSPDMWRWLWCRLVPIFKGKGDPNDASNYRPISLLNVASKILERFVSLQLKAYLDDCGELSGEQFGFRPHHSMDHAFITLSESIRSSIDNGNIFMLASLDLSRALDSVNHTIYPENLC